MVVLAWLKKNINWIALLVLNIGIVIVWFLHSQYLPLVLSIIFTTTMWCLIKCLVDFNSRMKRWLGF